MGFWRSFGTGDAPAFRHTAQEFEVAFVIDGQIESNNLLHAARVSPASTSTKPSSLRTQLGLLLAEWAAPVVLRDFL
jgi:hypothetical protein